MTTKTSKTNKTSKTSKTSKQPTVDPAEAEAYKLKLTKTAADPITRSAFTALDYGKHFGELDYFATRDVLREKTAVIHAGDTRPIETMLTAQADALDAIFSHLARRAALNLGEYIGAAETYLKLALRAQSQCRATLETLATIKNPPNVAFVKQANIAHGPQQVNNGTACEPARVEETANPPTELLEHEHAQRLDTGTASKASAGDPVMATVGTIDWAAHGGRKGRSKP